MGNKDEAKPESLSILKHSHQKETIPQGYILTMGSKKFDIQDHNLKGLTNVNWRNMCFELNETNIIKFMKFI